LENARLLEQAESANRLKSDFLATMSHELRTPLNIVVGYTDLLLEGSFGGLTAEQSDILQRVRKATGRELELITTMLDVGRLEASRQPVEVREVQLHALLDEVATEIQELLQEKPRLTLTCRVARGLSDLRTDRVKLKVVLKNLLHNAIKFTEEGKVEVEAAGLDGRVEFRVSDTGIGIAPEVQPVLFEMFRQGESPLTSRYGGVGLGLYIVKRLSEMLGGRVTLESEVGQGSTFRVWVPEAEMRQVREGAPLVSD
jgi:two-component system cell cycle sensor histidine kinase PleC